LLSVAVETIGIIAVHMVLLSDRLFVATILLCLHAIMSFNVESFVSSPKFSTLVLLKKTDLAVIVQHYKLDVITAMTKGNIWKILMEYFKSGMARLEPNVPT